MFTKIEGIILSKTPYNERDIIANLLLRSGRKVGVIFYRGRGGSSRKNVALELGHFVRVELKKKGELYSSNEWCLLWSYKQIRNNYRAFYFMCFILEIATKVAMHAASEELFPLANKYRDHIAPGSVENREVNFRSKPENEQEIKQQGDHNDNQSSDSGVFRVVSNAIFYLEDALKPMTPTNTNITNINAGINIPAHTFLFLSKLLFELGVAPNLQNCVICKKQLTPSTPNLILGPRPGGFICEHRDDEDIKHGHHPGRPSITGNDVYFGLYLIRNLKYSEYHTLYKYPLPVKELWDYLCYQFNWNNHWKYL